MKEYKLVFSPPSDIIVTSYDKDDHTKEISALVKNPKITIEGFIADHAVEDFELRLKDPNPPCFISAESGLN